VENDKEDTKTIVIWASSVASVFINFGGFLWGFYFPQVLRVIVPIILSVLALYLGRDRKGTALWRILAIFGLLYAFWLSYFTLGPILGELI
jgi:hypothetical protein